RTACRSVPRGAVRCWTCRRPSGRSGTGWARGSCAKYSGGADQLQRLKPLPLVFGATVEQSEEQILDPARDRTAFAVADLLAVDRADRRHFRRGTAHEDFVGKVQVLARQVTLDHA